MNNNESTIPKLKLVLLLFIGSCTFFLSASLLTSCKDDTESTPVPIITSFSPASGNATDGALPGALVTITGLNFSATAADNEIKFNGTVAITASATTTELTATVPQGATTGKITIDVNGQTVTSTTDFTILLPLPTITNFSPLWALPGSSIVITGTKFRTIVSENTVKINGTLATITAATSTQLNVNVPTDATTGKVTVETNGTTATSVTDFEVLKDIPRNGLVALYPFTGNGNCTNNNTLNFNFSLAGAPTLVNDRYNRPSQAISFNVSSQYSEVLKEVIPGQPLTVSFWMDPGSLTFFDHAIVSAVGNNLGYDIHLRRNDTTLEYYVYTSHVGPAGLTYLSPVTSYLPAADAGNIWISIILTFDGSTYKVYKDGVEIISYSVTPIIPLTAGSRFRIGGDEVKPFNGKLDDIVIYNRVLNTSEIAQLFQQTVSKY